MKKFTKKYQLWISGSGNNYYFEEFDTLEECLTAPTYSSDWYITQRVDFEVREILIQN